MMAEIEQSIKPYRRDFDSYKRLPRQIVAA